MSGKVKKRIKRAEELHALGVQPKSNIYKRGAEHRGGAPIVTDRITGKMRVSYPRKKG